MIGGDSINTRNAPNINDAMKTKATLSNKLIIEPPVLSTNRIFYLCIFNFTRWANSAVGFNSANNYTI